MSVITKNVRKKREVYGENFRWSGEPNWIAYLCFRVWKRLSKLKLFREHYGLRSDQIIARIQHYKSLTPESKDKSATPSVEVCKIYENNEGLSDLECQQRLQEWLQTSKTPLKLLGESKPTQQSSEEVIEVSDLDVDQLYHSFLEDAG